MTTIRLTAAQALIKYLQQQYLESDSSDATEQPEAIFSGAFAIFGHGNVAGLGEALIRSVKPFQPIARIMNKGWHTLLLLLLSSTTDVK